MTKDKSTVETALADLNAEAERIATARGGPIAAAEPKICLVLSQQEAELVSEALLRRATCRDAGDNHDKMCYAVRQRIFSEMQRQANV